jgi:hypothetical protein
MPKVARGNGNQSDWEQRNKGADARSLEKQIEHAAHNDAIATRKAMKKRLKAEKKARQYRFNITKGK